MNFKQISKELLTLARFGLVGVGATATHMLVAAALITHLKLNPFVANSAAFIVAFFISFLGHYFWSFQSKPLFLPLYLKAASQHPYPQP